VKKQILVAGASGLVGRGAIRAFAGDAACEVIATSRREPDDLERAAHFVPADLVDEGACRRIFSEMTGVTHLVFAALYEKDNLIAGWRDEDQIQTNARMLRNLFEPLRASAKGLKHVTLLQGTKAYGAHVRQIPVPAREDRDEFRAQPNFYWEQEDYLRACQRGQGWSFSIMRPQIIFGDALGAAMNPIAAIGVYGAVLKERGEKLHFPGGAHLVFEGVDADLLGRAIRWAGETDTARNQAFNVTNGDVMNWRAVWPAIADALGMEPGDERSFSMAREIAPSEWDAIRSKYRLVAPDLARFTGKSLEYCDAIMGYGSSGIRLPALVSTVKLRQAGFTEMMDSEVMLRTWFAAMQDRRLLPPR
jgi:nucleoside-diphosphate-sugar epimerase